MNRQTLTDEDIAQRATRARGAGMRLAAVGLQEEEIIRALDLPVCDRGPRLPGHVSEHTMVHIKATS